MSCDWRIRANGQPSCGAPILPAAVRWRVAALKERWRPAAMAHARSKSSRLAAFSCTFHGQMWRCPHSLSAPQGVVASSPPWPMCRANPAAWRPSSCTSHGQMWARCPLSLRAPQGVVASSPPFAHARSKSSRLAAFFLHISWANVGKMPTLLECPSRSGGVLAAIRPCAEQIQPPSGFFLHISWANVGKMPTLLEGVKKHAKVESEAHPFPPVQIHN